MIKKILAFFGIETRNGWTDFLFGSKRGFFGNRRGGIISFIMNMFKK